MPDIYALLVGINHYPVRPLKGPANDVADFKAYLTDTYETSHLHILELTDEMDRKPTRQNLVNAFGFFSAAAGDDICIFYFSGHGSFTHPPASLEMEGKTFIQTLVCADSRLPGGKDLVNKELRFLVAKTFGDKPGVRFVAITDCCYSGSVMKTLCDGSGITERLLAFDATHVPARVEEYLGFDEVIHGKPAWYESGTTSGQAKYSVLQGDYIHLHASGHMETAKELLVDGVYRGAFTYALLKALRDTKGDVSYDGLIARIKGIVAGLVTQQSPGIAFHGVVSGSKRDDIFLGEGLPLKPPQWLVYYDRGRECWCVNAGILHYVKDGVEVNIVGMAVTGIVAGAVSPDVSKLLDVALLDKTQIYNATLSRNSELRVSIAFAYDVPQQVKSFFQDAISRYPDPVLRLSPADDCYYLRMWEGGLVGLTFPGTDEPLFLPCEVSDMATAWRFLRKVRKVLAWHYLREMQYSVPTAAGVQYDIELSRFVWSKGPVGDDLFERVVPPLFLTELRYATIDGMPGKPVITIRITNKDHSPIFITHAYLHFDYKISVDVFEEMVIDPGKAAFLHVRSETYPDIFMPIEDEDLLEATEYLKLFIASESVSTASLRQEGIGTEEAVEKQARGIGWPARPTVEFRWAVETLGFRIIR